MVTSYYSSTGNYGFTAEYAQGIEVLYSYIEQDPFIAYTTVSYLYSDGVDGVKQIIGKRAPATQAIMNNLPEWMAMRKEHDSVGQTLAHSWGANLEDANDLFNEYRNDQFLSTADHYSDIHMGVSELSFSEEKVYTSDVRNLLFNSSFSMKAFARSQRPEGWGVSRDSLNDLTFSEDESIYGNSAIRLAGGVEMKQARDLKVPGGDITYSIYAKTETDTGAALTRRFDPTDAGLILTIHYADNEVDSFGVGFPKNTKNEWARVGLTVSLTKEVHSFEALIVNRSATPFVVDLPMLEGSKVIQPWSPSIEDTPIALTAPFKSVTGVQVISLGLDNDTVKKIELLELGSEAEFSDVTIPTRVLPYSPPKDSGNSINLALGRQVNFFEEIHPTMWFAEDGKITEKSLTTPDEFGTVQPRDLFKDQNGDLWLDESLSDANLTVKATTVLGNNLLVLTEESYAGKTAYYLKIVKPDKILYEDTRVQSVADLELPLVLNNLGISAVTEDIERIGLSKDIPGVIFVDTTLDRRFYYKLKFDYYYADFGVRKLFCRESYVDDNAHLQII